VRAMMDLDALRELVTAIENTKTLDQVRKHLQKKA
jgi:hypothetical protein